MRMTGTFAGSGEDGSAAEGEKPEKILCLKFDLMAERKKIEAPQHRQEKRERHIISETAFLSLYI